MPVPVGSRLGPYEILSAIGGGGMGEVYRARDSKLGRDVAMKVLPAAFARDAERMSRFQPEAKVLASLNHTKIATIHGLEEPGRHIALVAGSSYFASTRLKRRSHIRELPRLNSLMWPFASRTKRMLPSSESNPPA